jgi:hypothetical protein
MTKIAEEKIAKNVGLPEGEEWRNETESRP